jgi:acyl-coenzyme A thioesterase PaaI-like protein
MRAGACDNTAPIQPDDARDASMLPADADFIRKRVLDALAINRTPGYHFAGAFLDLQSARYDTGGVALEMDTGAHNADADGRTNIAAVLFLADMTLASACRAFLDPSHRTATLQMQLQFLGGDARGRLRAEASSEGFSERTALPQATCQGRILSAGREIVRMSGTWVAPPTADGRPLHPLPWERKGPAPRTPALTLEDLDALERAVVRRAERALAQARHGEFLHRFWAPVVRHTPRGAVGRQPIGLYVGNRVGHVQGGLSLNTALMTAIAAVPHHPMLTAVSAWYISPGQGKNLSARSTVLQKGRNVAVVRTELFATGAKRVLEVVSNHAIGRHGHA